MKMNSLRWLVRLLHHLADYLKAIEVVLTELNLQDLVLGVADLHTPEAVAAAESAMAGSQRVINLADNDSDSDAESSDDENEDDNDEGTTGNGTEKVKSRKDDSSGDRQPKKRPKIIELL